MADRSDRSSTRQAPPPNTNDTSGRRTRSRTRREPAHAPGYAPSAGSGGANAPAPPPLPPNTGGRATRSRSRGAPTAAPGVAPSGGSSVTNAQGTHLAVPVHTSRSLRAPSPGGRSKSPLPPSGIPRAKKTTPVPSVAANKPDPRQLPSTGTEASLPGGPPDAKSTLQLPVNTQQQSSSRTRRGPRPSLGKLTEKQRTDVMEALKVLSSGIPNMMTEDLEDDLLARLATMEEFTTCVKQDTTRDVEVFRLSSLKEVDLERLNVDIKPNIPRSIFVERVNDFWKRSDYYQRSEAWWDSNKDAVYDRFMELYEMWSRTKESGCRSLTDRLFMLVLEMVRNRCNGAPTMFTEIPLKKKDGKSFCVKHGNKTTFLNGVVDYISFTMLSINPKKPLDHEDVTAFRASLDHRKLSKILETGDDVLYGEDHTEEHFELFRTATFAESKGSTVNLETAIPQVIGESLITIDAVGASILPYTLTNFSAWKFGATARRSHPVKPASCVFTDEFKLDHSLEKEGFIKMLKDIFYIQCMFSVAEAQDLHEVFPEIYQ